MTPLGTVFLKLDRVLNDEIILNGGIKLFLDPKWNPEWNASVTGVVAALPVNHPANVNIGDEVAFSYRVVADRTAIKADYFQPLHEPMPYFKRYINGKGYKLTMVAMPGVISKIWAGTLVDKFGSLIDGVQGSESDADRWMAQFNFSNAADFKFNNLFNFNGKDYWKADLNEIFAKRVKGKVRSIGDRIICEPIEVDIKHKLELLEGKALPYQNVMIRYMDRGKVVSGGEDIGVEAGQIISFEEKYMERYEFWGKKYLLIKKHRVQGIWE
jgi:hypothetical protein